MRRSTARFLTTHTGSLPRPDDLIRMMFAKEEGVPVDPAALAARVRSAVAEVVGKQVQAGIDVLNDGELSKPSYATYIKDRLDGFGGTSQPLQYQDLVDFPGMARRVFGDPGRARRKTPACTGPISVRDPRAAPVDADNLKTALAAVTSEEAFLSAASPGVVSLFFRNDHYPSHEAYLFAIAEAMKHEYEAVAKAGFVLQVDCPDLAMGRHIQYAALSVDEFRRMARLHIDALNRALANVPPDRARLHLCWGNYEGPHHYDVPLADIIDVVFTARPDGHLLRGRQPPPRTRMEGVRAREAAGGQGASFPASSTPPPTSSSTPSSSPSASRAMRGSSAVRTSSPARTAASAPGWDRPPSIRTSSGPSWPAWPPAPGWPRASSGRPSRTTLKGAVMGQAQGLRSVGYFDCPGGGQVVVSGTTAYVAHMKAPHGTTIVDVSDPAHPRKLAELTIPPDVHSHKVRVVDGVMLVNREAPPRTQTRPGFAGASASGT